MPRDGAIIFGDRQARRAARYAGFSVSVRAIRSLRYPNSVTRHPLRPGYQQAIHRQNRRSFSSHRGVGIVSVAMTIRIIFILAVGVIIGPSWAYGSPACMTLSEARAKFPKAHLYWHVSERQPPPVEASSLIAKLLPTGFVPLESANNARRCWDDRPTYGRRALATVPKPSSRPQPMSPLRPKNVEAAPTAEESGSQCNLPCE
jgi:hypothetical protein